MEDFLNNTGGEIGSYVVVFLMGFFLGKKIAKMGFFFMLILAVGGYFIYQNYIGGAPAE